MDEHTIRVLEFEKVLQLLAAETAFSVGRELALAVRPEVDYQAAFELQSETAEMRLLDQLGIDVPFAGARDIRALIHSAAIGQVLEPGDLAETAQTLKTARRARLVLEKVRDRVPRLAAIADVVGDFRQCTDEVDRSISSRGEGADAASEQLAATRRELRIAESRLEQRAQAALADAIRRGVAQEGLLTERNGRKVIPVKADYRGQVSGIVHDVSSSGATLFIEPMASSMRATRCGSSSWRKIGKFGGSSNVSRCCWATRQSWPPTRWRRWPTWTCYSAKVRLARKMGAELPCRRGLILVSAIRADHPGARAAPSPERQRGPYGDRGRR